MAVSRRRVLKALAAGCLAGPGAAGCAAADQTVRVAVVWSGWELSQFTRVMDAFQRRYGFGYSIQSMGNDTGAFLSNEVAADVQPDVALIPQPSLVNASAARLAGQAWQPQDAPAWRDLLARRTGGGLDPRVQHGVWFKAAYESMVWHWDDLPVPRGGWTWDAWVAHCRALAQAGRPPLAIGAADGWVLALWFANILLSIDPQAYRRLTARYAQGPPAGPGFSWDNPSVWQALQRLAELWQIPGAFPGGPERALVTQFDESVLDVFGYRQAAMVVGADFYWPVITQYTPAAPGRIRWFPFPCKPQEQTPVIVGGDAAVLFRRSAGKTAARHLVRWLATEEAARIWAAAGGFLSINRQVTAHDYRYPAAMRAADLIARVQQGSPDRGPATVDLADQVGGPLGGDDSKGTWQILTDFFTDVAIRRLPAVRAAGAAIAALDKGVGGQ